MQSLKNYASQIYAWGERHTSLIIGVLAIAVGLFLAYMSRAVVINLIVFSFGLFLIYYGFLRLKVTKVTDFVDKLIAKIR
jgi:hypothetical protein